MVQDEEQLEQGDVLHLAAPRVVHDITQPGRISVQTLRGTWVVLSQSCDLENNKIPQVLLASALRYSDFAKHDQNGRRTEFRKALTQGVAIAYSLLPEFDGPPAIEWTIVDFHHLRLMDKAAVEEAARKMGNRLRLNSPYKEQLSQSYGRYMMRVALPQSARDFEKVKPE
ncbi:hypothetical protein JMF97_12620 [Micromonospora fiedleri]|uniref:Uncharacterized protein n=1 Tax=Micromonospora fiedleri TaxID=1157498 RepID=A0ABS1UKY4_9ACTN|nr:MULTISPECIES: hypothetical protein [Micromonospora]MBL6277006.1 hypothetical protein [Micromonospora fiedleri]WSK43288.1 hypothetical protein OG712_03760 [Micromonospora maris]